MIAVDAVGSKLSARVSSEPTPGYTAESAAVTGGAARAALVVEAAGHARAFETAFALTAPADAR